MQGQGSKEPKRLRANQGGTRPSVGLAKRVQSDIRLARRRLYEMIDGDGWILPEQLVRCYRILERLEQTLDQINPPPDGNDRATENDLGPAVAGLDDDRGRDWEADR
jgi:hypothetical protein